MTFRHGVVVLYNLPRRTPDGKPSKWQEADAGVLAEVDAVCRALAVLQIPCRRAGVSHLRDLPDALTAGTESFVFNLVESLEGPVSDAGFVPAVCRAMGKHCTGNGAACQTLCLDKWHNKSALRAHGVPVPPGCVVPVGRAAAPADIPAGRLIVKPLAADASEGIDARSVIGPGNAAGLEAAVQRIHRQFDQPALVEAFIAGRELNASVLERGNGPEVLPLAEIEFADFPPDKPKIVDYAAKWIEDSFEYRHTLRRIPALLSEGVANAVRQCVLAAWQAVGCRGYARVDLRLDEADQPFVLEVNPNPDISPDAGFAAALAAAGVPYEQFVLAALQNATGGPAEIPLAPPAGPPASPVRKAPGLRWSVPDDRDTIIRITVDTGFFRPDEIDIAKEVLDDALAKGKAGHYQSYTAEMDGRLAGWLCFGPTPCTLGTYDVYWIVVAAEFQRQGIGRALLELAEQIIRDRGGRLMVVETSSRPIYAQTRQFYLRCGYQEAARVPDFYAPGDHKLHYSKRL